MLRVSSLLLAVAVACAPLLPHASGIARGQPDLAAERRSLLAADAALAAAVGERGMLDGLVPALAEDAHYLQPQQPLVRGREAVRALFARPPSSGALRFAWRAVRTDVSADGTLGYTYGYGRYLPAGADSTPASGDGGYVAVWRQAPDGAWRYVMDAGNGSPPP